MRFWLIEVGTLFARQLTLVTVVHTFVVVLDLNGGALDFVFFAKHSVRLSKDNLGVGVLDFFEQSRY